MINNTTIAWNFHDAFNISSIFNKLERIGRNFLNVKTNPDGLEGSKRFVSDMIHNLNHQAILSHFLITIVLQESPEHEEDRLTIQRYLTCFPGAVVNGNVITMTLLGWRTFFKSEVEVSLSNEAIHFFAMDLACKFEKEIPIVFDDIASCYRVAHSHWAPAAGINKGKIAPMVHLSTTANMH